MSTFSKDIGNTTAADDTGEPIYVKRKIAFGIDGEAFDVSSIHPLPVAGTFTAGNPGFTNLSPGYPLSFPVTNVSQLLIAANPVRAYLHLFNHTQDIIIIQYGVDAGLLFGIPILPNELYYTSGYDLFKGDIHIISSAASTSIEILEGIN